MVHLRKGANGHLLKSPGDAADHLAKDSIGDCSKCSACTEHTQYQLVISGISVCNDVCYNAFATSGKQSGVPSPNGTYTVTQRGSPNECRWILDVEGAYGNMYFWNSEDCPGAADDSESLDRYHLEMWRSGDSKWQVWFYYWASGNASFKSWVLETEAGFFPSNPDNSPKDDCGGGEAIAGDPDQSCHCSTSCRVLTNYSADGQVTIAPI